MTRTMEIALDSTQAITHRIKKSISRQAIGTQKMA